MSAREFPALQARWSGVRPQESAALTSEDGLRECASRPSTIGCCHAATAARRSEADSAGSAAACPIAEVCAANRSAIGAERATASASSGLVGLAKESRPL